MNSMPSNPHPSPTYPQHVFKVSQGMYKTSESKTGDVLEKRDLYESVTENYYGSVKQNVNQVTLHHA